MCEITCWPSLVPDRSQTLSIPIMHAGSAAPEQPAFSSHEVFRISRRLLQYRVRPDRVLQEALQQQPSPSPCFVWNCTTCKGSQCTDCTSACAPTAAQPPAEPTSAADESTSAPASSQEQQSTRFREDWGWYEHLLICICAILSIVGTFCSEMAKAEAAKRKREQGAAATKHQVRLAVASIRERLHALRVSESMACPRVIGRVQSMH